MTESRVYTKEEVLKKFLNHIWSLIDYWDAIEKQTSREKLEGLAFSILNIFDGTTMDLPAMDLILRPHPDDRKFCESHDENWYEPGMCFNDTMLHEIFFRNRISC